MSKFKPPAVEENISPNLIPMIDIMFLLLLFFMLGADMSQREMTDVMLPEASQVQEVSNVAAAGAEYLTVNVHPVNDSAAEAARTGEAWRSDENWRFAIRSREYTSETLLDALKLEADRKRETEPVAGTNKYLSAVFVTIRADKSAPYGMIQRAMTLCALADLYKIDVSAAKPAASK
jgi:biopolymer transport protein ExbD